MKVSDLNEAEQFFLFNTINSISDKMINNINGVKIIMAKDFYQDEAYKVYPETGLDKEYVYPPPPFKYIDLAASENAKKLCELLNVDAVASVKLQFKGERYRDVFQLPMTPDGYKMNAQLLLNIFDKNGVKIVDKTISVKSNEWTEHFIARPGFTLEDKRGMLYKDSVSVLMRDLATILKQVKG